MKPEFEHVIPDTSTKLTDTATKLAKSAQLEPQYQAILQLLETNPLQIINSQEQINLFHEIFGKPHIFTVSGRNSVHYVWHIPPLQAATEDGYYWFNNIKKTLLYIPESEKNKDRDNAKTVPCKQIILNYSQALLLSRKRDAQHEANQEAKKIKKIALNDYSS